MSDITAALQDVRLRAEDYDLWHDYDAGRHRAQFASDAFRQKYQWLIQAGVVNLCPRIVGNFADLVRITSWEGANADLAGEIAAKYDLDGLLAMVVREALTAADAYINVWPNRDRELVPWFHRADQAGFVNRDDDPTKPAFFYQHFTLTSGDEEHERLNLYYPDGMVRRYINANPKPQGTGAVPFVDDDGWVLFEADGQPAEYRNESGGLSWVHFAFDADTQGGHGRSLLRDAIPVQDGLNHAYHSLLVSTERFARPLRGVLNYQPQATLNPATGQMETKPLIIDETKDSFIGLDGNGPVFEWSQANPQGLISIMEAYGSWMARAVGMPITDLIPDLGNVPSGAALRLLAASRTATVEAFCRSLTAPVKRLMALLGVDDCTPVWADPSPVDDTELWERATVKDGLGFPLKQNLLELGYGDDTADEIVQSVAVEATTAGRIALDAFRQGVPPSEVL